MLRLFIGLIAFLSASLGGWWYSLSTGVPLDEVTFENTPVQLEEQTEELVAEDSPQRAAPQNPEVVPTVEPPVLAEPAPIPERRLVSRLEVQSRPLRFGFRVPPTPRNIDTIVLHSSYNAGDGNEYDVEKTISQYETYGVGAHYLIDRKGTIYRLIDEANIAYHAGASKMPDGRTNVNDFSIGIEMIANESDGYTEKQYTAVNNLVADIKVRYQIKSVVGHGDIAPSRKTDPWKFDWKKLK